MILEKYEQIRNAKNLHELDKKLWTDLDIEICGASSAILKNALTRNSIDIDVCKNFLPAR